MPASEYRPQLATLVKAAPDGAEWLHEIKYDGYRIGARLRAGRVTLRSRNGRDWTGAFPEIARAAAELDAGDALLDGEVALVLPDGRTSFQALQNASGAAGVGRGSLAYFVFDLLRLDGTRLDRLPLEERKARLRALLGRRAKDARIRYAAHVIGRGGAFFERACRLGLEGIISKRRDAPYRPGRGGAWLKTKCARRQELVIGGFTDPEGARAGIGALLVGHYDGGRLIFAGKVGTGFTRTSALALRARLDAIRRREPPFEGGPAGWRRTRAHWVEPRLVAEVAFTEWTADGKIRHPSFQGLRADRPATAVRREEPPDGPPPDT